MQAQDAAAWPVLYGVSPTVLPRPRDWRPGLEIVGYFWPHLPDTDPPAELVAFLETGPPPVVLGFGSMVPGDPDKTAALIQRAVRRAGVRAVVQSDWAGLEVHGDDVLTVGAVPHEWLPPRAAAVVHHCGAGTTAAALRAGVPTAAGAGGRRPAVLGAPAGAWGVPGGAASASTHPFFLSQILAQPDAPMPASVRDAVLARTAGSRLFPVRRCLELLSCTPEPVCPELLDALGVSTATVGLLATTGLIDRHGLGVAFRHEIARSAILGATCSGSEPALHGAMIDALETIGADPSVLAHHAAAAGDVAPALRYAPAAAAEAVALRGTPGGRRVLRGRAAPRRATTPPPAPSLLEAMSLDLYLTDRLRDAIAAREQALELRRASARSSRSAPGTPRSPVSPGTPPTVPSPSGTPGRHRDPLAPPTTGGRWASPWPGTPSSRRSAATRPRRDGPATSAPRIADELDGDAVLRGTASIGVAVARLLDGDLSGRADLLEATTSACGTGSTTSRRHR